MSVECLWAIRAKRSVIKCVLHLEPTYTELVILQDEDVALRQTFAEGDVARMQAKALRERLIAKGWREAG